ncbi:MAG: hypothetical protein M1830_010400 [Pleopsidium flavum]|nr:MAG: hypothetical protein M1830_010400 [Pleopsidium flavum]
MTSSQQPWSSRPSRPNGAQLPARPSAATTVPPSIPASGVPPDGAPERHSPRWYAARRQEEAEAAERAHDEPGSPADAGELIARFMDCTNTEWELASDYLRNNAWDFDVAMGEYWTAAYPTSSDDAMSSMGSDSGPPWVEFEEEAEVEEGLQEESVAKSSKRNFTDENPNVDRAPAIKGRRDDSKLTITLTRNGKQHVTKYTGGVDWNDNHSVHMLNRFRQQIFRRNLDTVRAPAIAYHREENQFLVDVHREAVRAREREGGRLGLNWETIANDFNARFQGRFLDGSDVPRPARTKGSLQSQAGRMDEICEMTGKTPRQKSSSKPKSPPKPHPEPDDDGDGRDEYREVRNFYY